MSQQNRPENPSDLPREMQDAALDRAAPKNARFSIWRALRTMLGISVVTATLFTMWSPANVFPGSTNRQPVSFVEAKTTASPHPTLTPGALPKIALISGHRNYDSGATCPDGLTEAEVNYNITFHLQRMLREDGFEVDIMDEYDGRLYQFQGLLMLSIHNDTCKFISDDMTGYKVAVSYVNPIPENPERLLNCLVDRYTAETGMRYHPNTITPDMTRYHAFDEINSITTAAIIETGFLNLDRDILTNHADRIAQGIRSGVLCFARNEPILPTKVP